MIRWKSVLVSTAALALAALAVATPARAQSSRPTVAILDLDYGAINNWWGGNWDIGKGIADLIVDGLVEDGTYRVIERKRLDAILAEQNFSNSDRADPSAASVAKIGKALGVKYLLVGSITKFGTEKSDNKSVDPQEIIRDVRNRRTKCGRGMDGARPTVVVARQP